MSKMFRRALLLGSLCFIFASAAEAAHPLSLTGNWSVVGNQNPGALVIIQLAGVTTCRIIRSTIYGSQIEGVYCPATGRIVFVRKTAAGLPFQHFSGSVSQDGLIDRIGGTMGIWNALGGSATIDGPDYNFSAAR